MVYTVEVDDVTKHGWGKMGKHGEAGGIKAGDGKIHVQGLVWHRSVPFGMSPPSAENSWSAS